jgi:hypothetical protein
MRGRLNIAALAAMAIVAGTYRTQPPLLRDGTRTRRDDESAGPDLTTRDELELDLYRAEEAFAAARTPGARRKARRKVEAIRARLAPPSTEEPHG